MTKFKINSNPYFLPKIYLQKRAIMKGTLFLNWPNFLRRFFPGGVKKINILQKNHHINFEILIC